MHVPLQLAHIDLGNATISLFVPEPESVQAAYHADIAAGRQVNFPYWAKIWPSAIALAKFLANRPDLYSGKTVIELAAGLGLPSLVTAKHAGKVITSDYIPAAVDVIKKSVIHNRYTKMEVLELDWNSLPEKLQGDLLLLSDINYDQAEFLRLKLLVEKFIGQGTTILLATPQRLTAKPFIAAIAAFITEQVTFTEYSLHEPMEISVLQLNN